MNEWDFGDYDIDTAIDFLTENGYSVIYREDDGLNDMFNDLVMGRADEFADKLQKFFEERIGRTF